MWRAVTRRRAAVAEVAAGRVAAIVARRPVPRGPVTARAAVAKVAAGRAAVLPRRAAVANVGRVAEVPLAPVDVVASVKVAQVAPVKVPVTIATARRRAALVARTGRGWVPKLSLTRRIAIAQLTATRRRVPLAQALAQVARRWAVVWWPVGAWEQADVDGLLLAVIPGLQLVRDALVRYERRVCARTGSRLAVTRRGGGGGAVALCTWADA